MADQLAEAETETELEGAAACLREAEALAAGQGVVRWSEFQALFVQIEPGLSTQQLEHLWRTFDKDGDNGVSKQEFVRALTAVGTSARAAAAAVCTQVLAALQRQGQSVDQLFATLAAGKSEVGFEDFRAFFAAVEPGLAEQQLQQLWRSFRVNNDGGVSQQEFQRGLTASTAPPAASAPAPKPKAAPAPKAAEPKKSAGAVTQPGAAGPGAGGGGNAVEEACSRVSALLRQQNKSAGELFETLAAGRSAVQWQDFKALFAMVDPSLQEQQLQQIWKRFDRNGDDSVSREEFQRALAGLDSAPAAPAPGPGKGKAAAAPGGAGPGLADEVCSRVAAGLRKQGRTVDQLYDALAAGGRAVKVEDFKELFKQLEPGLTPEQLDALWRTFDKDGDGGISREEFKRTLAGVDSAARAAAEAVCARVWELLQRQGQTAEQLFEVLAAGKTEAPPVPPSALPAEKAPSPPAAAEEAPRARLCNAGRAQLCWSRGGVMG